ncbi:MAG: Glu-tRNA(Gln) amidotransferase subunit GatE [Bacteroidales bacterium]|nr:Glu-tRNA(Gln) amidotransferase subunit GatE [Bacteroidales bacterium]
MNPLQNYEATKKAIGYVDRKDATQEDYDRIGFMAGLEVHQQLNTKEKLFCHCPAGIYQKEDEYDAELLRHMRPTLSEMGGYDGTALMEFKTRKQIVYRVSQRTACTYEIDDTPPFPLNPEALRYALEIAMASRFNIVGEVHVTRKQYLDGSIPTGFQRTAILGVEGELESMEGNKIRLIQLSVEEDACREVSDVAHTRVYRTDRLGMPLIETVTYPDFRNPGQAKEAGDAIRFLNRSTGRVRTGMGAGRQDVNVSCKGGTRVEVKGVSHTKWIPEVTHNEAFRQWALLAIRDTLAERCRKEDWKMASMELNLKDYSFYFDPIKEAIGRGEKLIAVNLPHFKGILNHFCQPGRPFYDEYAGRLKVIACIERPNMATSEDIEDVVSGSVFQKVAHQMGAANDDAQIIFWACEDDVAEALDVIEERSLMAFDGVPKETRKAMPDGTSIFERVLPGADRMYPDTDSAPIPLSDEFIEGLRGSVQPDLAGRYAQLKKWGVPEDCYDYLFTYNLFPAIEEIVDKTGYDGKCIGVFFGQHLKHLQGQYAMEGGEQGQMAGGFSVPVRSLVNLFLHLKREGIDPAIAKYLAEKLFSDPTLEPEEMLAAFGYEKKDEEALLLAAREVARQKFAPRRKGTTPQDRVNNLMGRFHYQAVGNVSLAVLAKALEQDNETLRS